VFSTVGSMSLAWHGRTAPGKRHRQSVVSYQSTRLHHYWRSNDLLRHGRRPISASTNYRRLPACLRSNVRVYYGRTGEIHPRTSGGRKIHCCNFHASIFYKLSICIGYWYSIDWRCRIGIGPAIIEFNQRFTWRISHTC